MTAPTGAYTVVALRGLVTDFCPTCGSWSGAPCRTPGGEARRDHQARQPTCNHSWNGRCNAHPGPCPSAEAGESRG